MKTLNINGDIWFVDKIVGITYSKINKTLSIRFYESSFSYGECEIEEFEKIKFELVNSTNIIFGDTVIEQEEKL